MHVLDKFWQHILETCLHIVQILNDYLLYFDDNYFLHRETGTLARFQTTDPQEAKFVS